MADITNKKNQLDDNRDAISCAPCTQDQNIKQSTVQHEPLQEPLTMARHWRDGE